MNLLFKCISILHEIKLTSNYKIFIIKNATEMRNNTKIICEIGTQVHQLFKM